MATGLYVGVYNTSTGEIDWLNKYDLVDVLTLQVTDGLGATGDSLRFSLRAPSDYASSGSELPLAGQIVRLVIDDVKLFEGVIQQVSNAWGAGNEVAATCVANSYVVLLNRHLVAESEMPEASAGARIRALLREYASPFADDLSYIQEGPTIPAQGYDYQKLASVINSIAGSVGYLWYVDFDKRVHFFADLDQDAPITSIDADTETRIGNLVVDEDASDIANVVILKDFVSKNKNKLSHKVKADGDTSFFALPMPPFSLEDTEVYVKPEGSDTWVEKLVVEDPLNGRSESIQGDAGLAYLCLFNEGVRFPEADMPGPGDTVRVDYNPEIPDRVAIVFDEDSIREFARREGGDGHHEIVVSVSDFHVDDERPVYLLGQLLLRRRAWPVLTGSFSLRTTNLGEWKAGQTFTIQSTIRDIFDLRKWVASDYTTKSPVRVWVDKVVRKFELTPSGFQEYDVVSFTSQPWGK